MSVEVKVDISGVKRKLSEQNMLTGRRAMANQMLADMHQFVPKKDGTLRGTAMIGINGESLIWNTPYAKAQFYGTNGRATFSHYSEPGTGKRWDLKAKSMFMSDWVDAFLKGADI